MALIGGAFFRLKGGGKFQVRCVFPSFLTCSDIHAHLHVLKEQTGPAKYLTDLRIGSDSRLIATCY